MEVIMKKLVSLCTKALLFYVMLPTNTVCIDINLRLNERPAHISVYKWCKQRAKALVDEKRNSLLRALGASHRDWENTKRRIKNYMKHLNQEDQGQALPDHIKNCIYSILRKPYIQKKFSILQVTNQNNKIVALASKGKHIAFVGKNKGNMDADGPSRTIHINPTHYSWFPDQEIQAAIGHGLAHIKREHHLKLWYIAQLYEDKRIKFPRQAFEKELDRNLIPNTRENIALFEFARAQEIEADIVGIFNDQGFAQALHSYFDRPGKDQDTLAHPADSKRAAYFGEISEHMGREQRQKTRERKRQREQRRRMIQLAAAAAKKRVQRKKNAPRSPQKRVHRQKKVFRPAQKKKHSKPKKTSRPAPVRKEEAKNLKKANFNMAIFDELTKWRHSKKIVSLGVILGLSMILNRLL